MFQNSRLNNMKWRQMLFMCLGSSFDPRSAESGPILDQNSFGNSKNEHYIMQVSFIERTLGSIMG